jgi:E3 ubiquitin-protein ligase ZNF598
LYSHCRDKHERCHICDRRSGSRQQQYYIDYNALEDHFQKEHFLCLDKECLEKKFVVFESQMDLKAHQLEDHPQGLSKDARRDAKTVDMSTFDYRAPYQPQRQRREGRSAGRGRDPNTEALPVSSAQPLRRDELAYQRQRAIQSAQSTSARSFEGQLTSGGLQTLPIHPAAPAFAQPAASRIPSTPAMEDDSISPDSGPLTPQEQARRLRHAAVVERASNLLQNDALKISEFRTKVSNYRSSTTSAPDLIDSFFSLFDTSNTELGKLIKELAEIYEDESQRNALLKAWNDWRAINEDYPALPGSPRVASNTGAGGKRVLRLKSSTAQSSRSAVGRSLSSGHPFPPLPSVTAAPRTNGAATAWATGYSSSPSRPAKTLTLPVPRTTATTAPAPARQSANNTEAFPALPVAPRPNTLIAGLTRGTVRWDDRRNATPNAWGTANLALQDGSASASSKITNPESRDSDNATGRKGKGKKGKQTLFHFG